MSQSTEHDAIYLYCFTHPWDHAIESAGVDGGREVWTIERYGVAAVVSRVERDRFLARGTQSETPDPVWIMAGAVAHEQVIEEVMRRSPVVPVRFGTVFSSEEALWQRFQQQHEPVARFLQTVGDKQEWAVKLFFDLPRAAEDALAHDPRLRALREALPQAPGARYFQEKKLRDAAGQHARHNARNRLQEVFRQLSDLSAEIRMLKPQPASLTGRREEMVGNAAFLLAAEAVGRFRRHAEELAADCRTDGLEMEVTGPWPPYNFCQVLHAEGAGEMTS